MNDIVTLSLDHVVGLLRNIGESTRLRLLMLLAQRDLTVSDLTEILGQSQPRVSRHLKLMSEAGLLERYQEGAWAYFRLSEQGANSRLVESLIAHVDPEDPQIKRDNERLQIIRERLASQAAAYFSQNATQWDKIRSLHVDETQVEAAMLKIVGDQRIGAFLDLGTGTGRMLELFSHLYDKGTGIDASRDMLSLARSRLDEAKLGRVQTRQADIYLLPTQNATYDLVTLHQVLHYLDDPAAAIREAAKALAPGGRLLIVDFAPHELEFLRDEQAHRRLGFSSEQIADWLRQAGLSPVDEQYLETESGNNKATDMLTVCLWLAEN